MRDKWWHLYHKWCEIFGHDRAIGQSLWNLQILFKVFWTSILKWALTCKLGWKNCFVIQSMVVNHCRSQIQLEILYPSNKQTKKKGRISHKVRSYLFPTLIKALKWPVYHVEPCEACWCDRTTKERVSIVALLVEKPKQLTLFFSLPDDANYNLMIFHVLEYY